MAIDRVVAVLERGKMTTFDGFFKRSLQSFSHSKEVKRLSVLRVQLQTRFRKLARLARVSAKLIYYFRIGLVLVRRIERGITLVKRSLQPPPLIQRLEQERVRQELRPGGVVRKSHGHFFEVLARGVVIEIVK